MVKNLLHSLLRFFNARTSDIHAPRIPLVGTLIVVVLSSSLLTAKDQLPPASAFDMTEMKDSSTLDLKILKNELVPVATESGEKVR